MEMSVTVGGHGFPYPVGGTGIGVPRRLLTMGQPSVHALPTCLVPQVLIHLSAFRELLIEPEDFWDAVEYLHRGSAQQCEVARLRSHLEPSWQRTVRMRDHPLASQLLTTWQGSALELLSRKLDELIQIKGYERVLNRLGSAVEHASAALEMDFALKLWLRGYGCEFIEERSEYTADLRAKLDGRIWDIEITSLNEPHEDQIGQVLSWTLDSQSFLTKCNYDAEVHIPSRHPGEQAVLQTQSAIVAASNDCTPFTLAGPDGPMAVEARATDLLGNAAAETLTVALDNTPPVTTPSHEDGTYPAGTAFAFPAADEGSGLAREFPATPPRMHSAEAFK